MGRLRAKGSSGRARRLAAAVVLVALAGCFWTGVASAGTLFSKIPGELAEALYAPTAALLPDGQVLIAGGSTEVHEDPKAAQLFDPASGAFTDLGAEMTVGRVEPVASTLPDGKVLIAGGYNEVEHILKSAELYNPATGNFEATGDMNIERAGAGAALLPDGKVLVVGGQSKGADYEKTAELYDPSTGEFEALPAEAKTDRYWPGVVALPDGKVLIAGGFDGTEVLKTAELYNPATDTFEALEGAAHELAEPREEMGAVAMQDGLVLLAGGSSSGYLATEETFDYQTGTFEKLAAELHEQRDGPAAVTLPDGQVLIAGGYHGVRLKTAEETTIAAPAATTTPASTVGLSTATLNGTTLTEAVGTVYFQYGTTTGYGTATAAQPVSGSLTPRLASSTIAGLIPGTTYHFRLVVENAGGTSYGADQPFTTAPELETSIPPKPTLAPAPRIVSFDESRRSWREGSKLAEIARRPVGTTFSIGLNAAASIKLVFTQQATGRRLAGRCVAQTRKNRRHRACKRTVTRGALTLSGRSGTNKISFQGRLSRTRRLPLGAYTVTVTATNSAGHSAAKKLTFTIVR